MIEGLKDTALDRRGEMWEALPEICAVVDPFDKRTAYSMLTKTWHCYAFDTYHSTRLLSNANSITDASETLHE